LVSAQGARAISSGGGVGHHSGLPGLEYQGAGIRPNTLGAPRLPGGGEPGPQGSGGFTLGNLGERHLTGTTAHFFPQRRPESGGEFPPPRGHEKFIWLRSRHGLLRRGVFSRGPTGALGPPAFFLLRSPPGWDRRGDQKHNQRANGGTPRNEGRQRRARIFLQLHFSNQSYRGFCQGPTFHRRHRPRLGHGGGPKRRAPPTGRSKTCSETRFHYGLVESGDSANVRPPTGGAGAWAGWKGREGLGAGTIC